ncbi:16555_t:CDS:2 [Entrophospora sp. SA101]|nr:16555_t:CDS:2 [Entrophospora sp. SA101]CAJ0837763.1 2022_t:CDS:2 [Entrophospora sp. SA101]CAJ0900222.1 6823_t:CDS:2 [Entrophospora sp. SA101]CAJ0906652.1 9306_t:CDS:2 [Entrophospora sp. SA101]
MSSNISNNNVIERAVDINTIAEPSSKKRDKEVKDWDYLNLNIEYPHYDLPTEIEDLFSILLETSSLNEYKKCLHNATFDCENDIEMIFVTDVLLWFAKNILSTTLTFHSITNKDEALLGSLMIHPVLQYLDMQSELDAEKADIVPSSGNNSIIIRETQEN